MPSEHRLHPSSIVFAFVSQIRTFVVPGILVLLGARSSGGDWEPWMMLLIVPNAAIAVFRYLTYRYRYDPSELVIRSGLLFRSERHIPYARIQNLDAVQRLPHRALNVVEVRVETGGGKAPEATMSVLPVEAYREMRARVFAGRHPAADAATPGQATPAAPLLRLSIRELMLCGFIENRGAVLIAMAFGFMWEFGLMDRGFGEMFGEEVVGRGLVRDLARGFFGDVRVAPGRIALALAALAALLVSIRILSMLWAVVRLHGFQVTLDGDDLRSEYGLLTRVSATVPLHRIQTIAIRETPFHRVFHRQSVRVDTAGGRGEEVGRRDREWLAPLISRDAVASFVTCLAPDVTLDEVKWQPVSPRAFRREVKGWVVMALVIQAALFWFAGWWSLLAAPLLTVWAIVGARETVKRLGWAVSGNAIFFRSGWLWRRTSIVRFAKIQVVTMASSPFDRRAAMARVRVDAAGASDARVDIPYLSHDTAVQLHGGLAIDAATRPFRW